jgi:shikimate kinase
MKDQIWLTGFMGTGKSRLARPLAAALGWEALDLDTLIQQRTGDTITEIFERGGEAAFRVVEAEAVAEVARRERIVVATGGGTILSEANRNAMRERGFVVCLEARPDTIASRLRQSGPSASDRPLLKGSDPLTTIAALKEARQPLYAQADFIIHTDDMTPDQITHQVLTAFNEHTAVSATGPI